MLNESSRKDPEIITQDRYSFSRSGKTVRFYQVYQFRMVYLRLSISFLLLFQ